MRLEILMYEVYVTEEPWFNIFSVWNLELWSRMQKQGVKMPSWRYICLHVSYVDVHVWFLYQGVSDLYFGMVDTISLYTQKPSYFLKG